MLGVKQAAFFFFLLHLPLRKNHHFHSPDPSRFVFATVFIGVAPDQAAGLGLGVRKL